MSEFKGTKGEWMVYEDAVYSEGSGTDGNIICEAPVSWEISMRKWKANAKLISCAPEMLEMLKDVLSGMNNENFEITGDEIEQLIKKATE